MEKMIEKTTTRSAANGIASATVATAKSQSRKQGLKTSPLPGKRMSAQEPVRFERHFTRELAARGIQPMDAVEYVKSSSKIKDTDGRTVFEMKNVEVPAGWSQLAVD